MNVSDVKLIYDFNCWANRLLLSQAAALSSEQLIKPTSFSWDSLQETLVHILDSEYVQRHLCKYHRFTGRLVDSESFPDLKAIAAYWHKEDVEIRSFLDTLKEGDMEGIVRYEAEGRVRERVLWHCLWHMVNHGTQPRSQCAAMLKDLGHSVGSMDFTFYMNQRA